MALARGTLTRGVRERMRSFYDKKENVAHDRPYKVTTKAGRQYRKSYNEDMYWDEVSKHAHVHSSDSPGPGLHFAQRRREETRRDRERAEARAAAEAVRTAAEAAQLRHARAHKSRASGDGAASARKRDVCRRLRSHLEAQRERRAVAARGRLSGYGLLALGRGRLGVVEEVQCRCRRLRGCLRGRRRFGVESAANHGSEILA